jgi:hypothetical protein
MYSGASIAAVRGSRQWVRFAPQALRLARQRKRVQNRDLLHYARLLRVENPMSPYLQAIE